MVLEGGIPNDQIRIATGCYRTFAGVESSKTCRFLGEPSGCSFERHAPFEHACPYGGKTQLKRRNATPRVEEISRVERLEDGRRRRVIGGNQVDVARHESFPQAFAAHAPTNWRSALE